MNVYFESKGAGDLYIKCNVSSMFSSEIYIEDCTYWNEEGVTLNISSRNGSKTRFISDFEYTLSSNFELSYTVEETTSDRRFGLINKNGLSSSNEICASVARVSSQWISILGTTSNVNVNNSNSEIDVKVILNEGITSVYFDDSLVRTETIAWDSNDTYVFYYQSWNSGIAYISNLKIKSL